MAQVHTPSKTAEKWIMAGVLLLLSLVLLVPIGSGGVASVPARLPDLPQQQQGLARRAAAVLHALPLSSCKHGRPPMSHTGARLRPK